MKVQAPKLGFEPRIPKELVFETSAIPDYAILALFTLCILYHLIVYIFFPLSSISRRLHMNYRTYSQSMK